MPTPILYFYVSVHCLLFIIKLPYSYSIQCLSPIVYFLSVFNDCCSYKAPLFLQHPMPHLLCTSMSLCQCSMFVILYKAPFFLRIQCHANFKLVPFSVLLLPKCSMKNPHVHCIPLLPKDAMKMMLYI